VNRPDQDLESLHFPSASETVVCDKARNMRISIEAQGSCPTKAGYMFATFFHFKLNSALDNVGWTINGEQTGFGKTTSGREAS